MKENLYKPLSESDVKKIAESAYKILESSGVNVFSKTAIDAFEKAGAEVDRAKSIARLPRAFVEDKIAKNPSSITLHSRDGENDLVLEDNNVYFATGGTAIYVIDPETGKRRASTLEDVRMNAKMVESLENLDSFLINVFPNDIREKDSIDVNRFFHALDNTSKHVMGGIYSLSGLKKAVKMAEAIAGGAEKLREKPFVSFITLIISPFKIDDDYGEMTCFLAEKGLPVVVPTEPICGTTSPVTLAGNVLTHTAETLAGICLVQSVKEGAPGICGSVGSITDLSTMAHLGGPIERGMLHSAVSQMAQYFRIPLYSTAGTSDSKEMDVQASFESAMSSLLVSMSGANYIHDIAGLLEADLTVSYQKLAVDNEILGMCRRVLKGIEVNDDSLAVDLLIEKGPGKDYLAEEHTVKHMRGEFYNPELANRDKRESMGPGEDALSRADKKVKEILGRETEGKLPEEIREKILSDFPEIIK